MKRSWLGILLFAMVLVVDARQATPRNGKVRFFDDSPFAWHQGSEQWLPLDEFWTLYADEYGGLKWGHRTDYPPYEQVQELDKMIIQLEQGNCLLEFFHKRWRRANDVRRWDPEFNAYSGCPYVFE